MKAARCTDDELAAAMLALLRLGPSWIGPVTVRGQRWETARVETKQAFALRFPAGMDKPVKKKGRRA